MMDSRKHPSPRDWLNALGSGVGYLALIIFSRWLSNGTGSYIPFWLPAGLFIARLLKSDLRAWPALFVVISTVNISADLADGMPLVTSVALVLANTVEALLAAVLFRRFVGTTTHLATLREYLWFLLCSPVLATAAGASVGAGALASAHLATSYGDAWTSWWINNATAIMVLTPILLAWDLPSLDNEAWWRTKSRIIEMAVLVAGLGLSTAYLFVYGQGIASPNKLLPIPFILWTTLRFGVRAASGIYLAFALVVTFLTLHFLRGLSADQVAAHSYGTILHIYLTVSALISLIPAIALSERNELTQRLAESEERFRILGDASNEGIIISENGRIVDSNHQALTLFGYDQAEFIGLEVIRLVPPEQRAILTEAVSRESELIYEIGGLRKDGSTFPSEARPKVTRLGNRRIRITAIRDLTERKLIESTFRDNELRYRNVIEGSPESIIIHREGVIAYANPAALRMHGGKVSSDLVGRSIFEIVHPDFHDLVRERRRTITKDQRDVPMVEMRFVRLDGSSFQGEIQTVPLDYEGSPCIQVTTRDVTERREAQILSNRLAAIVESSDDCIISKDLTGTVTSWNRGAQRVFGYSAEEMIGSPIMRIIPADRHDDEGMILGRIVGGESIEHFETVRKRKDGILIDVSVTASPIRDSGGRVIGISKVARDITSRKRIETALRTSEEGFMTAQRLAHLGSWSWDLTNDSLHWSDEMYRLNGFEPGSPIPRHEDQATLYTPESWKRLNQAIEAARHEGTPYSLELEVVHASGVRRWLSVFGEADRDAAGAVSGLHGGALDITERKAFELKLLIGDQALRSISQGVIIAGQDRRIISVNPGFTAMSGYPANEMLGRTCRMLQGPLTDAATIDRIRDCLDKGVEFAGELVNYRKDGLTFVNELTISPIVDEKTHITHFVGVSRDITERKKAAEERHKLEQQLRQSQKLEAVGTLASGIAHDFNNILAGIYGFTGLAREAAGGNAELADYLNEINMASKRAAELVRQILAFSRTRQDEESVGPVHVDLIVSEVATLLRAASPRSIDIVKEVDPGLPLIQGHVSQLHQVIMNLGTNAVQAMGAVPGQLTLRLKAVDVDEAFRSRFADVPLGPTLRLTVTDTGCGMDARTLERAFEPFFTTKGPGEGTGLGLSVVHGIVRSHGGGINVRSELGHGTTFDLFFPVTETAERPIAASPAAIPRGAGERILFVDDEERIARSGKLALRQLGYAADAETQVLSALAAVKRDPGSYRLVISDQTMPYMTGLEFATRLHLSAKDLPVILTSGHSAALSPEGMAAAGVTQFLQKPFTIEALAAAVSRSLHPVPENQASPHAGEIAGRS